MPRRRHPAWRRLAPWCAGGGALGFVAVVVALGALGRGLPQIRSLADYRPAQSSWVYAADGSPLGHFSLERRTVIDTRVLPEHVTHAFLAAEDAAFFSHRGIDYLGILRAALKNLRPGAHLQGASTITQQTVKTLVLGAERSYLRKLREALLARQLEQVLSKDEILHIYLNQIYFGNGTYGIEAASQFYFGHPARSLTLNEATLLAAVPKYPGRYNIRGDPAAARARQRYVLEQMLVHHWVDQAAVAAALAEGLPTPAGPPEFAGIAPHYLEQVRRLMAQAYGDRRLLTGGLSIITGLDPQLQVAAVASLRSGVEEVARRAGWPGAPLRVDVHVMAQERELWRAALGPALAAAGPKAAAGGRPAVVWDLAGLEQRHLVAGGLGARRVAAVPLAPDVRVRALVVRLDEGRQEAVVDLGTCEARIALAETLWARRLSQEFDTPRPRRIAEVVETGDLVLVEIPRDSVEGPPGRPLVAQLVPRGGQEGALVAIRPGSRQVVAMVGGYGPDGQGFNRATQALRQPGSAYKPFLYAAALTFETITPASTCSDSPVVVLDPFTGTSWKPTNYEDGRYDGLITYRTALARSKNTCSVKLLQKLGMDPILEMTRAMGVASPMPRNLSLALGTGEMSLGELTNAYATIAAEGVYRPPILVTRVLDGDEVLEDAAGGAAGSVAMAPSVAYVLTDMMQSVVARGTARRAAALNRPVAAKTGTSQESRSVWFVGFTPELAAGVWMGFDNNAPLGRETGASAAAPAWVRFMDQATAGTPPTPFPVPEGVVSRRVERATGLLARDPASPTAIDEVFVEGTEPSGLEQGPPLRSIFLEDEDEEAAPAAAGAAVP